VFYFAAIIVFNIPCLIFVPAEEISLMYQSYFLQTPATQAAPLPSHGFLVGASPVAKPDACPHAKEHREEIKEPGSYVKK